MLSRQRARRVGLAVVTMLFTVALPAAAGTLCFMPDGPGEQAVCGEALSFAPAARERRAVWLDAAQQRVAVLVVAPKQQTIDPAARVSELRCRIGTRRLPHGARAIDFTLRDVRGRTWQWTLPGRAATPVIAAPAGVYTLEVSAPQAKKSSRTNLRLAAAPVDAGLIDLEPNLTVAGVVVDPHGVPIAGATIAGPEGIQFASTAADGTFLADQFIDGLPPSLIVRASGYASHGIRLADRRRSLDAGRIVLDRGATVAVKVGFDESPAHPWPRGVEVALYRHSKERPLVDKKAFGDGRAVAFSGVANGRYLVVVEGPGALQKYGETLEVSAPVDLERELFIEPVDLAGLVYRGAEPLAGASITIIAPGEVWRVQQVAGDDGAFGGVLWQRGRFAAMIRGGTLKTPFIDDTTIAAADASWGITVPDRQLSGVVSDAKSGDPIAGGRVLYESLGTRMRLSSYVVADGQGRFEITALPEGTFKLHATARGYLPSPPVEIAVRASEPSRDLTLALDAGALVRVRVVDDQQNPIGGATVLDGVDATGTQSLARAVTDAAGEVALQVLAGAPKRIYIIPREGSFAAATVRADDGSAERPLTVTVPSVTGALVVNARTESLQPIPRLQFLIRYNGEVLPQAFWTLLQYTQGSSLITDERGVARHPRLPPGIYELWPFGSRAEGRSIYMNPSVIAPLAKIGVNAADEQVVTLTFASR